MRCTRRFGTARCRENSKPKTPGLPKGRREPTNVVTTISDDELEEQLGKMGANSTNAIWDELVRDKPQHWDMHDALRLGKRQPEDPSTRKCERTRSSSPSTEDKSELKAPDMPKQDANPKLFIGARDWEGKDLHKAVDEGQLTPEQAASIMKLRAALGTPKP